MEMNKHPIHPQVYADLQKQGVLNIGMEQHYYLYLPIDENIENYAQATPAPTTGVVPQFEKDYKPTVATVSPKVAPPEKTRKPSVRTRNPNDVLDLAPNWEELLASTSKTKKPTALAAAQLLTASTRDVTSIELTKEIRLACGISLPQASSRLSRLVKEGFLINVTRSLETQH